MIGIVVALPTLILGLTLGGILPVAAAGPDSRPPSTPPSSLVASFSLAAPRAVWSAGPATADKRSDAAAGAPLPAPPYVNQPLARRALTAAAEVAGLNFGVWAFLHYFSNEFYTYISWDTIRENVRDGWEWDRSRYYVNFYHHPYHGYLYYSAGRANGLGFWGSSLAALGGSFMWEMIMEKNRPSINDLITTTTGGIVYGEIGYRFSRLIRKRGARGLGRIWREAVAGVLDPVGGANRLLNGHEDDDPRLPGCPDAGRLLCGGLFLNGPVVTRSAEFAGTRAAPILGFALHYGDQAGAGWTGHPFDVFTVSGRLRWGPDRPHLSLFIHGALIGKTFADDGGTSHFLGLYQHYEYYGFDTMRLAGTSFTGGWTSRFELRRGARLTASARVGWLGLGSSDDFLGLEGERRGYNMSTGVTAAADLALAFKGFEGLTIGWRHYRLFNLNVIGSRVGRESWNVLYGQLCVPVLARFGIGLAAEYCSRHYDFRDFAPGRRSLLETRAFMTWQF